MPQNLIWLVTSGPTDNGIRESIRKASPRKPLAGRGRFLCRRLQDAMDAVHLQGVRSGFVFCAGQSCQPTHSAFE